MSDIRPANERRGNTQLRSIFPAACESLRPFFEMATQWGGQSHDHLAYRSLKEQFPDLSPHDQFIVVITARRLLASGKFPVSS